jgi:vacuolar protein sorting-associated protein 13A/C
MSLTQMDHPDDSVRFMDDMDITLAMESKQVMALQRTNIDITTKPIVFRASQRDINLILAIVSRATQLASQSTANASQKSPAGPSKKTVAETTVRMTSEEKPRLIMSTEQVLLMLFFSLYANQSSLQENLMASG